MKRATLAFGDRVLFRDLSFDLLPGQILGVAGESGVGKTSLLRLVLGFVPLTAGSVEVCGQPLNERNIDSIRRLTAYVPQELQPLAATGRDLIALTHNLAANRAAEGAAAMSIPTLLAALGLDDSVLELQASKLSGGQRQRILLAAALALPKPLILLDEPTSALDAESARLVIDVLRRICAEQGRAALVVSHSQQMLTSCTSTLALTA